MEIKHNNFIQLAQLESTLNAMQKSTEQVNGTSVPAQSNTDQSTSPLDIPSVLQLMMA